MHEARCPGRAAKVVVLVVAGLLLVRLVALAHRAAVSLVYWDQWAFLDPFFRGASLLECFRWQHGPHRQGLAALVYAVLLPLTSWSGRAEAYVAIALIAAACALGLAVRRSVAGPLRAPDVLVPLAFFSLAGNELIVGAQNLANGPLPVFLVMAMAWTLQISDRRRRVGALGVLAASGVYTGFAIFVVPMVGALLLGELRRAPTRSERLVVAGALGLVLGSAGSFLVGYVWHPAAPCLDAVRPETGATWLFLADLSGRAWGLSCFTPSTSWREPQAVGGLLLFAALTATAGLGARALWRPGRAEESEDTSGRAGATVFLLCGFSVLYLAATALGRSCLGPIAALAPRYTLYSVPGICGLSLALQSPLISVHRRHRAGLAAFLLVGLLVAKERHAPAEWHFSCAFAAKKREWASCYRESSSVAECDQRVGFQVLPTEQREVVRLDEKLGFLRSHELSLFAR